MGEIIKERNYRYDALRGICMFLIVLQHFTFKGGYEFTDNAGNLIDEIRYPDYRNIDTPIQEENWEYTDGVLTLYTKNCFSSETGETYSQLKTVYEMVDGNPDLIKETTYTANGDSNWAMSGRPCVSEYRDFEGKDMESAIEFAVKPVEGQKNTNKLKTTGLIIIK